jgi:hypothetical protein
MLFREEGETAISGWRTRTPSGQSAPVAFHTAAFARANVAQSAAPALLQHSTTHLDPPHPAASLPSVLPPGRTDWDEAAVLLSHLSPYNFVPEEEAVMEGAGKGVV